MNIGVFDSGMGGKSVALAIEKAFPDHTVIFNDDTDHMPYGERTIDEIFTLVIPKLEELVAENCQVIVIACNSVSTTLIERLRPIIPVPLIGVEPLIKVAAELTNSKTIAVCATPVTLASERYALLKQAYAQDLTVLEPDCSQWARMIEDNQPNELELTAEIKAVLDQGADVIVLGCTHYHWIEADIKIIADGRAHILQPEPFVIDELTEVLQQLQ